MAGGTQAMRGENGWRLLGWGLAAALVLAPLVAMQFTREVNWTAGDFAFAIALVGGVGVLFELAVRASRSWAYRAGAALALLTTLLLVWINGAAGIIGSEDNPANLVFGVIILMAIAGTIVAKARAEAMVRAMAVPAGAHAIVGFFVLATGMGANEPPGEPGLFILIEGFAALWLGSALLFRKAAAER